ncbi:MAG TPA: DNA polymerase III subunit delta' [Nocardioides sp.]|nr:DNA polymerase III subunit delta' [Nocardioides sp.]
MTVWDGLVGQAHVIDTLRTAVANGPSQSWLFTGPPGSGRSNAALAFAAALQCEQGGCGECHECRTALGGSHADVQLLSTQGLSIGVDQVRALVRSASLAPARGRFQVMIVEDSDRVTEQAQNALLKAVEEPGARTVWLLCAPTVEDVLPTIRSRCRLVTLSTPSVEDVAGFLTRVDGVNPADALQAARASQGHIGRARALARDEGVRARRRTVVSIPAGLESLAACLRAAEELATTTKAEADERTTALDAREKADLDAAFGVEPRGRKPREYGPALSALEKDQKRRATRRHRDIIDRALVDLMSVYRDAIAHGLGGRELINEDIRPEVEQLARTSSPEAHLRRIGVIQQAREQLLEFNVTPQLALESMMVGLVTEGV